MGTDWKKELRFFFIKKILFSNFPSYHLFNFLMLRNKKNPGLGNETQVKISNYYLTSINKLSCF